MTGVALPSTGPHSTFLSIPEEQTNKHGGCKWTGTPYTFEPESRLEFKAVEEDQEPVPALQELSHTELLSQKAVKHTDSLHPSPPTAAAGKIKNAPTQHF